MKSYIVKIIFLLPFIFSSAASACSVCFSGLTDLSQITAVKWGVLTLLFIVIAVIGGLVAFFINLYKKARRVH